MRPEDDFLAKLKERARESAPEQPGAAAAAVEPAPQPARGPRRPRSARPATEPRHSYRDRRAVAFWQSEVVEAHVHRRISGEPGLAPAAFFAGLVDEAHRGANGISLRAGDPALELALLRNRACATIAFVDPSAERLEYARARVPEDLLEKVRFEKADPVAYEPAEAPGLVVSSSALHRVEDPRALIARFGGWLPPGGMVYVDEFVGPDRFQWTDAQIEIVNRLLARLPQEYRVDLAADSGAVKEEIGRPNRERFARDHPHEAVAPAQIRAALDAELEPVEVRPYGGAVFHQLFARIMGNFVRRPEVVELILELDAILTDHGVVTSDYLWAAYQRRDPGNGG